MKILSTFVLLFAFSFLSHAQLFVDTLPHNKNVLIEEHTGVQCNSCPQGHIEIANLLAAYPNRVFAAGMHSASVGHSDPYPGDEDLRRVFPDLLSAQIPDLTGIPSGIISRRAFNGKESHIFWPFQQYHAPIDSAIDIVMAEASPFNIGVHADYDTVNKMLHVTSQVFATQNAGGNYHLNVYFTQSNIFVSQLSGSTVIPNYNEKHVFREILTPTWGSTLSATGVVHGNVFNSSLTFSNSARNYKMQDVEVIVFITDHAGVSSPKGKVVQVIGVPVTLTGAITTAVNNASGLNDESIAVYPNPTEGGFSVTLPAVPVQLKVYDVFGKEVFSRNSRLEIESLDLGGMKNGIYFLNIISEEGTIVRKIIKE